MLRHQICIERLSVGTKVRAPSVEWKTLFSRALSAVATHTSPVALTSTASTQMSAM